MIQTLIDACVGRLREELGELLRAPEAQVVAGTMSDPPAESLPMVVLSPGALQVAQSAREAPAGAPRPQSTSERLTLDPARPGPLRLSHSPLEGTARGRLILSEGTLAEEGEPLVEGRELLVDYRQARVALTTDLAPRIAAHAARTRAQIQARAGHPFDVDSPQALSGVLFDELGLPPIGPRTKSGYYSTAAEVLEELAGEHPITALVLVYRSLKSSPSAVLRLDYAFAGVFTVREFEQALVLDVYDVSAAGASRLGSLAAGVLLTCQDELRAAAAVEHVTKRAVSTSHRITRLEFASGAPEAFASGSRMRLTFRTTGQLKLVREAAGSVGIIERIHSRGSSTPGAVSVAVELG